MTQRGKSRDSVHLGVAAALGLPLAPDERGRVYRLPPTTKELGSAVPLAGTDLPKDIAISSSRTQAGRVSIGSLVSTELHWEPATPLTSSRERLRFPRGAEVPVVVFSVADGGTETQMQLGRDNRITIRTSDRLHLGLAADGDAVLAIVRREDPERLLIMGERSLSAILREGWGHAR